MLVAVIGEGDCPPELFALAERVGAELARRGATVICGGLGGVMLAACKGAKAVGGTTVGILPGTDPTEANPFVDIPIATGLGEARNVIVVRSARAVVAVGGAYGTLSEIAFALKFGKPVIGLETWELFRRGEPDTGIIRVDDPETAAELACSLAVAG
jgi:uncharacterized protein (TIGR00725 family)